LFTFSAVCLHFFSCLFTIFKCKQFSCLFTFLKIWIFAPKLSFSETFCHYGGLSPKLWNSWFSTLCLLFCLHFQLFVYIVSCLFTFFNCLFTFLLTLSAVYLHFSAVYLHFSFVCLHFQQFVYIFFSCLFTFLKIWILAPKLSFSETFCHYGGLSPKLWNFETFFSVFSSFLNVQFF
jgi:hypothetical protein